VRFGDGLYRFITKVFISSSVPTLTRTHLPSA
jgi:hypothetical protein